MRYHHCTELERVIPGTIKNSLDCVDEDYKEIYSWLEKEIGFYPMFLAVGKTDEDFHITGYNKQWRKILSEDLNGRTYRKKGEIANDVLFSFKDIDGVFMDYNLWEGAICKTPTSEHKRRLLFKYSWSKGKWLQKAEDSPASVQLVVPELHLPDADRIWVRNKPTKKLLESKGFENVEVKRIPIEKDWDYALK